MPISTTVRRTWIPATPCVSSGVSTAASMLVAIVVPVESRREISYASPPIQGSERTRFPDSR